jgi:hypothetical protein
VVVPEGMILIYMVACEVENLSNNGAATKDSQQGPRSECSNENAVDIKRLTVSGTYHQTQTLQQCGHSQRRALLKNHVTL